MLMPEYQIDEYFEFQFSTETVSTGAETDADATPTYRVYEENNDTVIDNGNCARRDDANTTGWYLARAQITTALGYEVGKDYIVKARAVVATIPGSKAVGMFRVVSADASRFTRAQMNDYLVNEHGDAAWNRGWNMAVTVQNTTLTVTGGYIDGDSHLWLTRDDDHDIDITLTDAAGTPINIAADTLYLTCRKSDEETSTDDTDAVFQVLGTVTSGVNGQARFEVGKTQTDECTLNRHYYYDICLIAAHGDVTTPIKGRLTNTGDVTRRVA